MAASKPLEAVRRRLKQIAFGAFALIAGGVVIADAGLIGSAPERTPSVRTSMYGEEGSWQRVKDKGRVVTSIIAERTDRSLYQTAQDLELIIKTEESGARYLMVRGSFEVGAGNEVARFLTAHEGEMPQWIAFNVFRGYMEEAESIARQIRELRLNTMVREDDVCGFVCMVAFIGGVKRAVTELPYIGGGRFTVEGDEGISGGQGVSEGQKGTAELFAHFREMGVDPTLIEQMIAAETGTHYRFSAAELRRASFAMVVK